MAYGRNGYRGRQARRSYTPGRVARPNARPGDCRSCGETVPAGAGELWREESGAWSVVHSVAAWHGSPTSGQYAGGCPAETDRMNAEGKFGPSGQARPERDRLAGIAALYAASHAAPVQAPAGADLAEVSRRAGSKYAYTASGARMTMASRRCEDAPCCGCCD